jgi:hypothetical protein
MLKWTAINVFTSNADWYAVEEEGDTDKESVEQNIQVEAVLKRRRGVIVVGL